MGGDEFVAALRGLWGTATPATWNQKPSITRAWLDWCTGRAGAPHQNSCWAAVGRRREPEGTSRALSRDEIELILTMDGPTLRKQVLWLLLYERAARASEVLALVVEELDQVAAERGRAWRWVRRTRSDKTSALAIPAILEWPGPGRIFSSVPLPGRQTGRRRSRVRM